MKSWEFPRIVESVVASPMSPDGLRPQDVQASFCSVLVDEWIRQGVSYAALAPGSRSTPIALALVSAAAQSDRLVVDIFHDERSAGFAALGSALVSGRPGVALCTSGTAAAHFHAAVMEADLSAVPLIVCTADRPAELRDVGAPQTVDQTKMFGQAVRWFHDPGVPVADSATTWRSLAARSYWSATGSHPGPVHINLPFREPLVGEPIADLVNQNVQEGVVASRERRRSRLECTADEVATLARDLSGRRGVIVAGRGSGDPKAVAALAEALGWPVFAEPRAGCGSGENTVLHYDALLRVQEVVEDLVPDIVLRVGEPPASKVLFQWAGGAAVRQIHIDGAGQIRDPDHRLSLRVEADPELLLLALSRVVTSCDRANWLTRWQSFDQKVRAVIAEYEVSSGSWSGLTATRAVLRAAPVGAHVVIASSMPIRDAEWFAGDCSHLTIHSNRGANGIDGIIATAVGVARASRCPTVVLLGDVAAIHDASTLLGLARHGGSENAPDVRVVVINNDGGGIFHHLPQASALDSKTFEFLYGTPHAVDFTSLGRALGLETFSPSHDQGSLSAALRTRGPSLLEVRTDRHGDLSAHRDVHALIAASLRSV